MFVALIFAVRKTGSVIVQRVNVDRTVLGALLISGAGFFTANSPSSFYEDPWAWGRQQPVDIARLEVTELIPDDAVVRSSPKLLPLLTERVALWEFTLPQQYDDRLGNEAVRNVNWFIFDRSEVPIAWTGVDILDFQADLKISQRFVQVYESAGVEVYVTPQEALSLGLEAIK